MIVLVRLLNQSFSLESTLRILVVVVVVLAIIHGSDGNDCTMFYFFIFNVLFIYLFIAALGLCCCARAFSSCGEQGLLFVVAPRLLIAVAC